MEQLLRRLHPSTSQHHGSAVSTAMHLLNYSLLKSTAITVAAVGQFSGTKAQEICVARGGTRLELLRADAATGKLESVTESEVFGTIRSLAAFKLTGGSKGQLSSSL